MSGQRNIVGLCAIRDVVEGRKKHVDDTKCGRKPGFGHNVSHSARKTNRMFQLNLQSHKLQIGDDATPRKYQICTQCMRTMVKDQI